MLVDLTIIALFLIINLYIGFKSSEKIDNFSNFSVGDRSFSSLLIFCTISATFIGGGYTIGNAGKVYSQGLVYAFALLGFSLKEVIVAIFIAPKMDRFNQCHSVGDMIAMHYGLKAKVITGILSLLVCGGILGAQVNALSAVIETTLPVSPLAGVVIGFSVLLVYASVGGMRAVVFTDVFQFLILAIGIPLTFFLGLYHVGGVTHVINTVPHQFIYFLPDLKAWLFFILLFLTFIFGETLVPPYVQRLFMAKTAKHTAKGTLWAGLVSVIIFLLSGAIGLIAYVIDNKMASNDALTTVVNTVLPVGLKGFVIAALLSIILSSAAGFLNAAAISFVNDLVKPFVKDETAINFLKLARISTFLVGIIALVFALLIHDVLDVLLMAYNFWSPFILVPLVAAIFNIKAPSQAFFVSAFFGVIGTVIWKHFFSAMIPVPPLLSGLLCSLLGFTLAKMFYDDRPK